jgi:hypothetical protein
MEEWIETGRSDGLPSPWVTIENGSGDTIYFQSESGIRRAEEMRDAFLKSHQQELQADAYPLLQQMKDMRDAKLLRAMVWTYEQRRSTPDSIKNWIENDALSAGGEASIDRFLGTLLKK